MRCDDDYAWGGVYLHGPYKPDTTLKSIASDVLFFCTLALRAKAVPAVGLESILQVNRRLHRVHIRKNQIQRINEVMRIILREICEAKSPLHGDQDK